MKNKEFSCLEILSYVGYLAAIAFSVKGRLSLVDTNPIFDLTIWLLLAYRPGDNINHSTLINSEELNLKGSILPCLHLYRKGGFPDPPLKEGLMMNRMVRRYWVHTLRTGEMYWEIHTLALGKISRDLGDPFYLHLQGRIRFYTVNPSLSTGKDKSSHHHYILHSHKFFPPGMCIAQVGAGQTFCPRDGAGRAFLLSI